jgi:hypothetical protein
VVVVVEEQNSCRVSPSLHMRIKEGGRVAARLGERVWWLASPSPLFIEGGWLGLPP